MSARHERLQLTARRGELPERGAQPVAGAHQLTAADLVAKPWLTTREAALYLSLPTVNALRRRLERGTVPAWCWTRLGGSLRFSRAALDELLAGRATDARSLRAIARR